MSPFIRKCFLNPARSRVVCWSHCRKHSRVLALHIYSVQCSVRDRQFSGACSTACWGLRWEGAAFIKPALSSWWLSVPGTLSLFWLGLLTLSESAYLTKHRKWSFPFLWCLLFYHYQPLLSWVYQPLLSICYLPNVGLLPCEHHLRHSLGRIPVCFLFSWLPIRLMLPSLFLSRLICWLLMAASDINLEWMLCPCYPLISTVF